jgi:hypothetical protein
VGVCSVASHWRNTSSLFLKITNDNVVWKTTIREFRPTLDFSSSCCLANKHQFKHSHNMISPISLNKTSFGHQTCGNGTFENMACPNMVSVHISSQIKDEKKPK